MLDALLAGVIVDEAGALVRDFDARPIGCRRRRAATGGTAYRLHRQMEPHHRRAITCPAGPWRGRSPAAVEGDAPLADHPSAHQIALPSILAACSAAIQIHK